MNRININTDSGKLAAKIATAREVIEMNLMSSIRIKERPAREASFHKEKIHRHEDYGYQLYRTLEFGKSHQNGFQDPLNLDILSSRLR
jgi:hypothetical protein